MSAAREAVPLLADCDPSPVEWVNRDSAAPLLLVCEHAGNHVPERLANLGLARAELRRHIGWDIGAESLARQLATSLQAPLLLQRYSRLVIDCNRPPGSEGSVPHVSDDTAIAANAAASETEILARQTEIFSPFDRAVAQGLARHPRRAAFSIHSFTPSMGGVARPWHGGFLSRRDLPTAERLMAHVGAADRQLSLALNQPYQIDDDNDWFIPRHAEPLALKHCLIEIRNDQLGDAAGVARWAELLGDAIRHALEQPS